MPKKPDTTITSMDDLEDEVGPYGAYASSMLMEAAERIMPYVIESGMSMLSADVVAKMKDGSTRRMTISVVMKDGGDA